MCSPAIVFINDGKTHQKSPAESKHILIIFIVFRRFLSCSSWVLADFQDCLYFPSSPYIITACFTDFSSTSQSESCPLFLMFTTHIEKYLFMCSPIIEYLKAYRIIPLTPPPLSVRSSLIPPSAYLLSIFCHFARLSSFFFLSHKRLVFLILCISLLVNFYLYLFFLCVFLLSSVVFFLHLLYTFPILFPHPPLRSSSYSGSPNLVSRGTNIRTFVYIPGVLPTISPVSPFPSPCTFFDVLCPLSCFADFFV